MDAFETAFAIHQTPGMVVADIIVAFDYEKDGGYNSCEVMIDNGADKIVVELGGRVIKDRRP